MGLFDSLAGSMLGKLGGDKGAIAQVAVDLFNQNGGLPGIVEKFNSAGFDKHVASWVGKGENLAISFEQIAQVLGSTAIDSIAAKLGMNSDEIGSKIAEHLPLVIDKMTPDGEVNANSSDLIFTVLGILK